MGLIQYDPENQELLKVFDGNEGGLLANHVNLVNVDQFDNNFMWEPIRV